MITFPCDRCYWMPEDCTCWGARSVQPPEVVVEPPPRRVPVRSNTPKPEFTPAPVTTLSHRRPTLAKIRRAS